MSTELERELNDVPEHWLAVIAHFVMGHNNDTVDVSEPILKPVLSKIYPLFIIIYAILALFGVVTNLAIIVYIMRYKLYRDTTNAFIVNLAFCQFVQCLIVLPITLMVLMIQNWVFGQFLCFFLPLMQDIPLHVAMISHLLIAWDRMRWLSDPLKSRIPAFVCCCASWLTGMVIALPYPIYTTYLDLGMYLKKFRGVGICAVNLVDDMQEYTRGLFIMLYCAPMTVLAYLYIRTSRELRPPDGPLAVMMFEARADARKKQRTSSSSSGRPIRTNSNRSYDLYDAELDLTREKRTQRHLGAMAVTQVICICPLMILRLARMALVETYDNAAHFDITYLLFVWIAFLPTVIVPWIYASWVLSRPAKERLRGYFRLSSRHSITSKHNKNNNRKIGDDSITQDNTTITSSIDNKLNWNKTNNIKTEKLKENKLTNTVKTSIDKKIIKDVDDDVDSLKSIEHQTILGTFYHKKMSIDPLTNSCSNITSSTYCNNGTERDTDLDNTSSLFTDKDSCYDKKPLCDRDEFYRRTNSKKNFHRNIENIVLSERDLLSRKGSTSTLERDMEIIDLLERERSMDIQEMIAKERRAEQLSNSSRQSSLLERRRKLPEPDYTKQSTINNINNNNNNSINNINNINTQLVGIKEINTYINYTTPTPTPNQRDRTLIDEKIDTHNAHNLIRKNSRSSSYKRDSINSTSTHHSDYETPIDPRLMEHRINRSRGSGSSRSSTTSKERGKLNGKDYRDNSTYADEL